MNVENFFPEYSLIDIPNTIYRKKEFNELTLPAVQAPFDKEKKETLPHQKIITRYLSPYTLYEEALLFHYPGTGKTCTAIGVAENVIKHSDTINKAIIILPNSELINKFIREVIYTCTDGSYLTEPQDVEGLPAHEVNEKRFNLSAKNVKKVYSLYTYDTFHDNVLKRLSDDAIRSQYSNSVIVIDEIHNLVHSNVIQKTRIYDLYYKFLHLIDNRKIIVMSGTPMLNDARDIARIMNLILPLDTQIPVEEKEFDQITDQEFQQVFSGRVSYLRSKTGITVDFMGEFINPITFHKLYASYPMTNQQYDVYRKVHAADKGWKLSSQQASAFVFPDGSYGSDGFKKYVNQNRKGRYFAPFLEKVRGKSTEEKLRFIARFSCKYASAISNIIYNPKQNVFVFSESITGGGAIMFGLCLRLFGYAEAHHGGIFKERRMRYAILSDLVNKDVNKIIDSFNRKKNSHGGYLQVLIGGKKVSEGFTFRNVQQLHVLTPQWNYSNIEQAIARGNRLFAHRNLPNDSVMKVFLHVAYRPNRPWNEFIDLEMYNVCQNKDFQIKRLEYLLKTSSFDCSLTYARNKMDSRIYNDTRMCEYRPCNYKCFGITGEGDLLYDTYVLYYSHPDIKAIHKLLLELFTRRGSIPLRELYQILSEKGYPVSVGLEAIRLMINLRIPVVDRSGLIQMLHERDNILYLSNHLFSKNESDAYYTTYPVTNTQQTVNDYLQVLDKPSIDTIRQLKTVSFQQQVNIIVNQNITIQEAFIESAMKARSNGIDTPLIRWILDNYYTVFIKRQADVNGSPVYISILLNPLVRRFEGGEWTTYRNNIDSGTFGTYNKTTKQFMIVRDNNPGRVCSTLYKSDIIKVYVEFNIPLTPAIKKSKAKLCKNLEEWFLQNNLIV